MDRAAEAVGLLLERGSGLKDARPMRTSDFILFRVLKALSQLAEQAGSEQDEECLASGLCRLASAAVVQVQVGRAMKVTRRSPFHASPLPRELDIQTEQASLRRVKTSLWNARV